MNHWQSVDEVAKPIVEMISSSTISVQMWSTLKDFRSRLNGFSGEHVNKMVFVHISGVLFDEIEESDFLFNKEVSKILGMKNE